MLVQAVSWKDNVIPGQCALFRPRNMADTLSQALDCLPERFRSCKNLVMDVHYCWIEVPIL